MEKDTLRLECLKLACAKTSDQQEILAKAEQYVNFVNEHPPKPNVAAEKPPPAGNTKP